MLNTIIKSAVTSSSNRKTLQWRSDRLQSIVHELEAQIRAIEAKDRPLPNIVSHDALEQLQPSIWAKRAPWSNVDLGYCQTPGMVSADECRYMEYIGRFYSGAGACVELGPWLGRSTHYIIQGLKTNPHFAGRHLYVYDDFVWRPAWMNKPVQPDERLAHGADFLPLFNKYSGHLREWIAPEKRRIVTFDGNDDVPLLEWNSGPIEIMYVDCGRTIEANEAWWRTFSPSFIPGRTLLVLQDWGTHRSLPWAPYNQMRHWVGSKAEAIQMVHEVKDAGIGMFLYRG